MARLAPSRPDQRGGPDGDAGVEAGGDYGLDELAGHRLEHHGSRMGHQRALERRRRVLRHGVTTPAAFGGLGPPVPVLGRSLAALLAPPPLLGLGPAGGGLDGGSVPAQVLERAERHAPRLRGRVPPRPGHRPQRGDNGPGVRRPDHEVVGDLQVGARDRLEREGVAAALVGMDQHA